MATKRLVASLVALLVVFGAIEVRLYEGARPRYQTAHFDSPSLALDYPATWRQPHWLTDGRSPKGEVVLRSTEIITEKPFLQSAAGFNTIWDRDPQIELQIKPTKRYKDRSPKEILEGWQASPNETPFGTQWQRPVFFKQTRIAGMEAWALRVPYWREALDIGLPKSPGPLKAAYNALFETEETETHILLREGDTIWEITYRLPGDKIARARYERVFGRILASLKVKGS